MRVDVCGHVWVCTACDHWQLDVTPRARSEHGGAAPVALAAVELHRDHVFDECIGGTEGRVKIGGEWVDRIIMPTGETAAGILAATDLPRWWVWR